MSAIFGICILDEQPVAQDSLKRMQQSMAYWGPDGASIWSEGPVGLGHLMLYNTPEARYETLPLCSEDGHTILTAGARLDNRADLFRKLDVPSAEQAQLPDGALILKAYQKWGVDCPAHLLGDWAFAVWDVQRQRLFVARDHFGVTGLCYYAGTRKFVFASSLKGLLALSHVPRHLNPLALGSTGFLGTAATAYEGIMRLTPGQAMTVSKERINLWHYWRPSDAPTVRFHTDQAYVDAFLELYREAVQCRLRSYRPVGVMLSGGLDSGSIATLAAQSLARSGQRLSAFSAIPAYDVSTVARSHRIGDESALIQATCQAADNIDLTTIRAEEVTPLAALERGLYIHELPHGNANYSWILALMESAQQQQVGTLLDGWGGNFTISWAGDRAHYLKTLLVSREWKRYWQEAGAYRRTNNLSLWGVIRSLVVRPWISPIWMERYRQFGNRGFRLVNRAALHTLIKKHQPRTIDYEATRSLNPGLYHYFRNGHTALWFELAAMCGIESRQPAMDKRLIEFCLGIPHDQHLRHGQHRLLIRRAMAGLMPESVLWSKQRGLQSADIGHRIRASKAEIQTTLRKLESSDLARHYLDFSRLEAAFQTIQSQLDQETPVNSVILLIGLRTGLFLQHMEDSQSRTN